MSKGPSLESLGLHPTLVAALRSSDAQSMPFLSRVLSRTATDFADVLIDSRAVNTKERHALLVLFALHSVLSSSSASSASSSAVSRLTALVVVRSKESADHLMERLRPLALHCEVEPLLCATKRQQRPPDISQKRRVVVVATAAALRSFVEAPFLRTVAAVAVEDMAEYDERQLVSVLRSSTSNNNNNNNSNSNSSNRNNNSSNMMSHKAQLMLMCDDSLARVSPALRGCLCRCNRRYYHFSPHVNLSPCEPDTVSGTAPPASNQMLYMLYHNEGEHEELLHRVLRMYRSRRVVLLTHHKEIKHMVQIIKGWNIYNGEEDFLGSTLRTDTAERHESTMASFLHNNNSHNNNNHNNNNSHNNNNNTNNNNKSNKSNKSNNSTSFGDCGNGPNRSAVVGASLLVVWDAFTAVDLLDVDVLIQYYPLQKSLTDRERAEFVQVLHTTANPDPSPPNNFPRPGTVILTFLAPSDFTLASFFMRQYGQCGHILNIAPGHPDFEECLRDPDAVLRIKQKKQKEKDQQRQEQQQQQQEKQRQERQERQQQQEEKQRQERQEQQQQQEEEEKQDEAEAHAQVSAPLPLPRSMRRQSSGNVSEQPRVASGDCRRPTQADKESEGMKRR